jgi:hypothetical protein
MNRGKTRGDEKRDEKARTRKIRDQEGWERRREE